MALKKILFVTLGVTFINILFIGGVFIWTSNKFRHLHKTIKKADEDFNEYLQDSKSRDQKEFLKDLDSLIIEEEGFFSRYIVRTFLFYLLTSLMIFNFIVILFFATNIENWLPIKRSRCFPFFFAFNLLFLVLGLIFLESFYKKNLSEKLENISFLSHLRMKSTLLFLYYHFVKAKNSSKYCLIFYAISVLILISITLYFSFQNSKEPLIIREAKKNNFNLGKMPNEKSDPNINPILKNKTAKFLDDPKLNKEFYIYESGGLEEKEEELELNNFQEVKGLYNYHEKNKNSFFDYSKRFENDYPYTQLFICQIYKIFDDDQLNEDDNQLMNKNKKKKKKFITFSSDLEKQINNGFRSKNIININNKNKIGGFKVKDFELGKFDEKNFLKKYLDDEKYNKKKDLKKYRSYYTLDKCSKISLEIKSRKGKFSKGKFRILSDYDNPQDIKNDPKILKPIEEKDPIKDFDYDKNGNLMIKDIK